MDEFFIRDWIETMDVLQKCPNCAISAQSDPLRLMHDHCVREKDSIMAQGEPSV